MRIIAIFILFMEILEYKVEWNYQRVRCKARLEREIDNLPADARYRERKIHDMTLRLDGLYDTIVELEERIEDAKLRRCSIEMEAITLENVYKIMRNFVKLYAIMSDEEKKSVISYLIKEESNLSGNIICISVQSLTT